VTKPLVSVSVIPHAAAAAAPVINVTTTPMSPIAKPLVITQHFVIKPRGVRLAPRLTIVIPIPVVSVRVIPHVVVKRVHQVPLATVIRALPPVASASAKQIVAGRVQQARFATATPIHRPAVTVNRRVVVVVRQGIVATRLRDFVNAIARVAAVAPQAARVTAVPTQQPVANAFVRVVVA